MNPILRQDILQALAVNTSRTFVTVWVTTPNRALAAKLGRLAVASGSAACAQVSGPLESIYRWQGAVESAKEWRLVLKTRARLLPDLEALVIGNHPYDTPQFLVLPVLGGSAEYLEWLGDCTQTPARTRRTARRKKTQPR